MNDWRSLIAGAFVTLVGCGGGDGASSGDASAVGPTEDSAEPGTCGVGEPEARLRRASADPFFEDGDSLTVMAPSQGGGARATVTLSVRGFDETEHPDVTLEVIDGSGAAIADATYVGSGLSTVCLDSGRVEVAVLPIPFDTGLDLADLDGTAATLRATLDTMPDPTVGSVEVVLSVGS